MFHQIPGCGQEKVPRKKWLVNIRREGQLPEDKCFHISPEHFEDECYERHLKVRRRFVLMFLRLIKV